MRSELLPCPFCGEEVEWHKYSQTARRIARQNGQPLVQMIDCTNKECGATFSFNTPIKSLARSECRKAFNNRTERTCKVDNDYCCSECESEMVGVLAFDSTYQCYPNYCPNCGARVEGD